MPDDIFETEEQLCNKIMDKACLLQSYLLDHLMNEEYNYIKDILDDIWCAAHTIKGDC